MTNPTHINDDLNKAYISSGTSTRNGTDDVAGFDQYDQLEYAVDIGSDDNNGGGAGTDTYEAIIFNEGVKSFEDYENLFTIFGNGGTDAKLQEEEIRLSGTNGLAGTLDKLDLDGDGSLETAELQIIAAFSKADRQDGLSDSELAASEKFLDENFKVAGSTAPSVGDTDNIERGGSVSVEGGSSGSAGLDYAVLHEGWNNPAIFPLIKKRIPNIF